MMPNRILKESICTSCEIQTLGRDAEILFYRLLVSCDDYGRMDARPPVIRGKCFPLQLDNVSDRDIQDWLERLTLAGIITVYDAGGKPYLYFNTWERHQQIRAKHSKYPNPPSSEINGNHLQSNVPVTRESRIENRESLLADNNILKELLTLPQWGDSAINHDLVWLTEFRVEFPDFGIPQIRACRDYHSMKRKHGKGLWKTRLRNWMGIEVDRRQKSAKAQTNPRQIPGPGQRTPTPNYND